MTGLTKREKIMLFVLLVFGTLSLFIAYVLMPSLDARKEELTTLSNDRFELEQQLQKVEQGEQTRAQLTDADAEAKKLYGDLYGKRTYDTGLMLSNMLNTYSLSALELEIGERYPSELVEGGENYAFCREVALSFTGERENADAFVDAISAYDTRYVLHDISINHLKEQTEYIIQLTLFEFEEADAVNSVS